jgi:hypothetical protein
MSKIDPDVINDLLDYFEERQDEKGVLIYYLLQRDAPSGELTDIVRDEILTYLKNRADVEDGPEGYESDQRANEEMRLQMALEDELYGPWWRR